MKIKVRNFGFAAGATAALLYVGCYLSVLLAGTDHAVRFFNNLFHGVDFSAIIRTDDVGTLNAILGLLQVFVMGWLVGACLAGIYNISLASPKKH